MSVFNGRHQDGRWVEFYFYGRWTEAVEAAKMQRRPLCPECGREAVLTGTAGSTDGQAAWVFRCIDH